MTFAKDGSLAIFDGLSQQEQRAWEAWFAGGRQHVTQYADEPDNVHMGKAECEWVPFTEFWIGKLVDLGWMTATVERTGVAKGKRGMPTFTEYHLWPTSLGFDVKEAMDERFAQRLAEMTKRAPA